MAREVKQVKPMKFDRRAYMRRYMQLRRKKKREDRQQVELDAVRLKGATLQSRLWPRTGRVEIKCALPAEGMTLRERGQADGCGAIYERNRSGPWVMRPGERGSRWAYRDTAVSWGRSEGAGWW